MAEALGDSSSGRAWPRAACRVSGRSLIVIGIATSDFGAKKRRWVTTIASRVTMNGKSRTKLKPSSFFRSMSHWFFMALMRTSCDFSNSVWWKVGSRTGIRSIPARAWFGRGGRPPSVRTSTPPGQVQAPRDVVVFLVREEVLVEVLAVDADRLEGAATNDRGGSVDPEDLDRLVVLAHVPFSFAARREAPLSGQDQTGGVDDVRRPVALEIVAEELADRGTGVRVRLEEREDLGEEYVRWEEVGVAQHDELARCLTDTAIHRAGESGLPSISTSRTRLSSWRPSSAARRLATGRC